MADLHDIEHLLFLLAEDVPAAAIGPLPQRLTTCGNYHLTPAGEQRTERIWPAYAVALRQAGVTVHLRASVPDTFGEVTVIEAGADTVAEVLSRLDDLPAATVVAIALAGGNAPPVAETWGPALGAPGTLLIHTPWTDRAWVSDEICDHTSLIQLCERWTASLARPARAGLGEVSEWRRRVCGDLVAALDLGEPARTADPDTVAQRDPAPRPLPYAPAAQIRHTETEVILDLSNAGGSRGVHLRVTSAEQTHGVTVPASSPDRPRIVSVGVVIQQGVYDVTVTGPGGFHQHFTGDHYASRTPERI